MNYVFRYGRLHPTLHKQNTDFFFIRLFYALPSLLSLPRPLSFSLYPGPRLQPTYLVRRRDPVPNRFSVEFLSGLEVGHT